VCFDTAARDSQPETVTVRAGIVGSAGERCEEIRQLICGDAAPFVEDTQYVATSNGVTRGLDPDTAAFGSVFEGVADHILDGAVEELGTPLQGDRSGFIPDDLAPGSSPASRRDRVNNSPTS